LKSLVRNVEHRSHLPSANRNTTENGTLLIPNAASLAGMRVARTLEAEEDQEESDSDLRSHATNAVRLTLCHSSLRLAGPFCVETASAQIVRPSTAPSRISGKVSQQRRELIRN
jgi:hypothetical protein